MTDKMTPDELLDLYVVKEVGAHVGTRLRDLLDECEMVLATKDALSKGGIVAYEKGRADQRRIDAEKVLTMRGDYQEIENPHHQLIRRTLRKAANTIAEGDTE